MTVAKEPGERGEHEGNRSNHCVRECRVIPVYSLLLVCVLPLSLHTRPRVHWASGIPHALFGRKIQAMPRAHRVARTQLIPHLEYRHCEEHLRRSNPYFLSLRGEMDCFASLAMTTKIRCWRS